MTYPETIKYLETFINYEKILAYPYKESLKLERVKYFLDTLGAPQGSLQCIHIAGSKGKGSTCAFVAYILRQAGYRVGLYTSPHLVDFRERIRILDTKMRSFAGLRTEQKLTSRDSFCSDFEGRISENELAELVERLRPKIEDYNKNSAYGELSFFEVYTSLALVYFKERKVDFAVLETGIGGRFDATNVVEPCVCAITPLSYEHTQKLGNTLREIALEKAGIIKSKNSIVISARQEKEAIEVIRHKCKEIGARLYEVNKDIFYEKTLEGFNVMGIFLEYPNLELKLLGEHQLSNAAVAIGVVEALRFYDINIDSNAIREGLYNTIWPGRCEVISKEPLVVLDGAQNIASCRALRDTVQEKFKYKKLILVLGISCDKDIQGICNELYDLADIVILSKANNPRAVAVETLAKYFTGKETYLTSNVEEARSKAFSLAKKEDLTHSHSSLDSARDSPERAKRVEGSLSVNPERVKRVEGLILVTGSLFVVGEFRNALQYV